MLLNVAVKFLPAKLGIKPHANFNPAGIVASSGTGSMVKTPYKNRKAPAQNTVVKLKKLIEIHNAAASYIYPFVAKKSPIGKRAHPRAL